MEQAQTNTPKKRTRAEVLRAKVKIALAQDADGPAIAQILKDNGIELQHADWGKVFPHWLVAQVEGQIIGCLQVMPVKPVAWCAFLYTAPSANFKHRAIAIRALAAAGMSTCYHAGCQYVAGMVDSHNKAFIDVLKRIHFVDIGTHTMLAKLLKE